VAQQRVAVAEVLMRHAAEVGAVVAREGLEFGVVSREVAVGGQQVTVQGLHGEYDDLFLPLFGAHQAGNAACAVAAVEAFAAPASGMEALVDLDLVRQGLGQVASPGRLEVVRRSPTVMVDAAHNPAGIAATVDAVQESFTFTRLVGVVAVMADKDIAGILEPLEPMISEIVVTRNSSPRSMPPEELAELAVGIFGQERVRVSPRMDDALDIAIALAEEEDDLGGAGVLATGSVVTAADVRTLLGAEK
jgi:dihydrofolate synthase/folylpolyglutamate synthase